MEINVYLRKMKEIHTALLETLKFQEFRNQNNESLFKMINDLKIKENKHELRSVLHILSYISNNYHRSQDFFCIFFEILKFLKNEIKINFSNNEVFYIFKENKRILLFLIEEKILIVDKNVVKQILKMNKGNYPQYFISEIKAFIDKKCLENYLIKIDEDFEEKRKIGENDNYICELIRKDLVKEFIIYTNKNLIPLNSKITESIFETNPFLIDMNDSIMYKNSTLIEYAAFYGSLQILRYLVMNSVKLTPSLWIYAIHSANPEL